MGFYLLAREFINHRDRLDSLMSRLPIRLKSLLEFRDVGYLTRPDDHFYLRCHLRGVALQNLF